MCVCVCVCVCVFAFLYLYLLCVCVCWSTSSHSSLRLPIGIIQDHSGSFGDSTGCFGCCQSPCIINGNAAFVHSLRPPTNNGCFDNTILQPNCSLPPPLLRLRGRSRGDP